MTYQYLTPPMAVAILNQLIAADQAAMHDLIGYRVPCNEAMTNHPTAQVVILDGQARIGLLGVLNALFGTMGPEAGTFEGYGYIAACFDEGKLTHFALTGDPPWTPCG